MMLNRYSPLGLRLLQDWHIQKLPRLSRRAHWNFFDAIYSSNTLGEAAREHLNAADDFVTTRPGNLHDPIEWFIYEKGSVWQDMFLVCGSPCLKLFLYLFPAAPSHQQSLVMPTWFIPVSFTHNQRPPPAKPTETLPAQEETRGQQLLGAHPNRTYRDPRHHLFRSRRQPGATPSHRGPLSRRMD